MRILFVNTNRNRFLAPAPIGAMLVADRLRKEGHTITFLDLMHSETPVADLENAVHGADPQMVCYTIRNRDNQQMTDYEDPLPDIRDIVKKGRGLSRAVTLIGGTAVTTFPSQMRKTLGVDYAFAGDSPDLIAGFVRSVEIGSPDTMVPGLVYDIGGGEQMNPPSIRGYAGVGFSGFDYISLKKYSKTYYDCGMVTHTGCPMGCFFCDAPSTFGRDYKTRDISEVVSEMTELKRKYGARSVWLVNAGVNRPVEYAKELMARIAEAKVGLGFACIIEPGDFDEELARFMRKAGCQLGMVFGTTLSDKVLERNGLYYRSKDVLSASRTLEMAGISGMLGLMFGAPGETLSTVEESLEMTLEIKPVFIQYGIGFRLQPGTPLLKQAIDEGFVEKDFDPFTTKFYCSPESPPYEIKKRIKAFEKRHPLHKLRMIKLIARSVRDSIFGF